jgi:hypothetical protein
MTLRKIHEEEERHWEGFSKLITDFSEEPERFDLIYTRSTNSIYLATMPYLFDGVEGEGRTAGEAKTDFLQKIATDGKYRRRNAKRYDQRAGRIGDTGSFGNSVIAPSGC